MIGYDLSRGLGAMTILIYHVVFECLSICSSHPSLRKLLVATQTPPPLSSRWEYSIFIDCIRCTTHTIHTHKYKKTPNKLNKNIACVLVLSICISIYLFYYWGMQKNLKSLLWHIGLFVLVEIVFVLIVFREFPETNLYTKIGIAHIIYRCIVLLCALWRSKAKTVNTRAIALWTPIVIHLLIHIWIWRETVAEHSDHDHWHEYHWSEELIRLIIGTVVAGIIIYLWEKYLHRAHHCDTHHTHAHQDCIDSNHGNCEWSCEKK